MKTALWMAGSLVLACGVGQGIVRAQETKPPAQTPSASKQAPEQSLVEQRAQVYYLFTMGKLYESYYDATGSSEYATQAIDSYKKAYEFDPRSAVIGERLAEMYAKSQRIRAAVTEAQDILKRDPDNLAARRLLARIYLRTLGNLDPSVSQRDTLTRAAEQLEEILKRDPDDSEAALWLARLYRLRNEHEKALDLLHKLVEAQPDNEDAVQQYAQLLLDMGKNSEAASVLEHSAAQSNNAELLGLLGEAYLQAKEYDKAEKTFQHAMDLDARDTTYRRKLARTLAAAGKQKEALEQYLKLIEMEPEEPENYLRAAQIYRQQNELDEAEDLLAKAREQAPGNLEVLYNEALLYEMQGRFEETIQLLSDAVSRVKANAGQLMDSRRTLAVLYEQLGRVYREVENYQAALNTFREMATLGPEEQQRAQELIVDTLRASKQLDRAIEESQKAMAAAPRDRDAKITHALLLGEKGSTDDAAKLLRSLMAGSRDDRGIYLALAQVYERGKRWTDAEAAAHSAERLARRPEENEMVYFLLGAIFERQGKVDQAEAQFRRALELNPKSGPVLNYYGYMLADHGLRLEEAVGYIRRALDQEPYNGAYLDSLGWAYFKMNKLAEAEEFLRKAVERSASDPEIRDHMGDILAASGRIEQAVTEWERALAEWKRASPTDLDPEKVSALETKVRNAKQQLASKPKNKATPK
jgi:tetratricopeptide (TPR) repeat protein